MSLRTESTPLRPPLQIRRIVQIFVVAMVVYLVIAGIGGLHGSLNAMQSADLRLLLVGVVAIAVSYVCAALTYMCLSPRPLRLIPTLWVELAGGLVNRLLPAGLGGLGLNALYLKKQGLGLGESTVVVAVNNCLGFVGNALLVLGAAIAGHSYAAVVPATPSPRLLVVGCLIICTGTGLVLYCKATQARAALRSVSTYIRILLGRPRRSFGALCSSTGLTALHATGLYMVLLAAHVPATWPIALLAISGGAVAGAVVPTPGGVGGAEAGIASVLLGLGIAAPAAAAAAIMYRGITYWLPLLPGYLALRVVEKRYL